MFEGVVIRTDRKNSATSRLTVRKITSGVGVEKSYLIHSPLVEKIVVMKRGKVRRNNLSYLRQRAGKSARLVAKDFDKDINDVAVAEEVEITEKAPVQAETPVTEGETASEAPAEVETTAEKPAEPAENEIKKGEA
jgi:large subunit ribosomal protein L19